MRIAPGVWAKESFRTYVGNATAVRDYRSQIRGNRALVLLTLYLTLLLLLTGMIYTMSTGYMSSGYNDGSISYVQYQLSQFYNYILMLLAGFIAFVTPALSALSVVGERQRKSLDLIFSAPVSPHYFLVGKLISSVRWVAMLIVLALPISAVSIVMGGATWLDAIGAYVILLSAAMVYASMAIVVSSMAPSPVFAVVLSYIVVGIYAFPMGGLAAVFSSFGMGFGGSFNVPWYIGLSPFTASMVAPGFETVFGVAVPNWILVAIASAAVTRLLLLAAASGLSGYGAKDTRRLRQWALVVVAILVYWISSPTGFPGGGKGFGTYWGASTATLLLPLGVLLPHLVSWAYDAGRKFRPDGWFNFRAVWLGTPSGSLPYLMVLWAMGFAASAAKGWSLGHAPTLEFAVRATWLLSLWFFWWGVGQYLSSVTHALRTARVAVFAAILMLGVLPLPILAPYSGQEPGTLIYTMLAPVILTSGPLAAIHTVVLTVFGMLMWWAARKQVAFWRLAHGGT